MSSKDSVYAHIKNTGNLPTLPAILLRLLDACEREDTPLAEIGAIIAQDPALTFKVLQLVNSAYFGLRRTFTSIEQAVVYLGAYSIRNIAVASSVHQVFERKRLQTIPGFELREFWWQSLFRATLAKRIAQKTAFASPEEAYLAGFLLDIGKLALISTYPREYQSILALADGGMRRLAEQQLIGLSHPEAGAWLIENWRLGSLIADAIRYHHAPPDKIEEALPLVKIATLANQLAEGRQQSLEQAAVQLLPKLETDDLEAIVAGATDEVVQAAVTLHIQVQPPSPEGSAAQGGGVAGEDRSEVRLSERIKGVSLLSGFLENLLQSEESEAVIAVFEEAMRILYGLESVLFFLPDRDGVLLCGRTSGSSPLRELSRGLVLPLGQTASRIVRAYGLGAMEIVASGACDYLADFQILSGMRTPQALFVPLQAEKKPVGVVLLGLPETLTELGESDHRLIRVMAQQVGLRLHLKAVQEKKAEELEAERVAAVRMTARKFAHEINNPLGIIGNYLTTMKLKLPPGHDSLGELSIIGEEINRISAMVAQMDLFSQTGVVRFTATDINTVVGEIISLVTPGLAAAGTSIAFRPEGALPPIPSNRDKLKQILINLLKNAAEAMPGGGRIEVRTRLLSGGVAISVSDNGPGMPPVVLAQLYKPLVTTKKVGHSGLGLSIVNKAVKDLGGRITCASPPGGGTTFTVTLPLCHD